MSALIHCPRCERDLPESEFGICRARKSGRNLYDKRCVKEKIQASRAANRARGLRGDGKKRVCKLPKAKAKPNKPPKPIEDGSIDAGLLVLSKLVPYGMTLTHREIAEACGCHRTMIAAIEHRALSKIRQRLETDHDLRNKLEAFA